MAAQGTASRLRTATRWALAYWLAAAAAAALSLAAALFALAGGTAPASDPRSLPREEAQLRNERIQFHEARLAADPFNVTSLNLLANEYLQRARETADFSDYARAEAAAARSLAVLPDYYGSIVAAAAVRNAVHDFRVGLALAERAAELRPEQPAGHGLRGDALLALGRYDEAGEAYQRMVTLEGGIPALSRLAHHAFLTGDLLNASDFWRQAESLARSQPRETEAWVHVQSGQLRFDTGDLDGASRDAALALKVYPDYVHALALRARTAAAAANFDAAIRDYEAVVARQPLLEYVIALGETYQAAGRDADASRQYALVEAIAVLYQTSGVNTDTALALFYSDQGRNLDRAVAMARTGYEAAPGVYAADALAWALHRAGRSDEALPYATEALRAGTPDALLHYHAGLIHRATGNTAEALSLLRRAIDLNPRFSPVHAPIAVEALRSLESERTGR